MRETRSIMGMPVQLEIVDAAATQAAYQKIFEYLRAVDERFSTYKEESELSRINRGEVSENEYSTEMREVLALCEETREQTEGYFDVRTPDGTLDPSGLVKGWAINTAANFLKEDGFKDFYLEIAGDIQTNGRNREGKAWSIGIQSPFRENEMVKVIYPRGKGVATSGTYARGAHLYNPMAQQELARRPEAGAQAPLLSLTVIGPNVYEADRFATASFVMGEKGLYFLESLPEFEAYAIDSRGNARMTSGFEAYTT